MNPLKILFIITDLGIGGAERFLLDLTCELENYEFIDFKIASLEENVDYVEFNDSEKMLFLDYKLFSFGEVATNEKYTRLLDEFKPDIIHSNRFLGEFITSYDVRENIKYVCHGHDNMVQFSPFTLKTLFLKER